MIMGNRRKVTRGLCKAINISKGDVGKLWRYWTCEKRKYAKAGSNAKQSGNNEVICD